jgi:pimeloyl-ACP methyl ester carboxylesterase
MARPGADIYYELRGAGPVLLLIAGGNGDAVPFQALASALAEDFTVLTYDRRGFSRSVVTESVDDHHRFTVDIEDASRLLDLVSDDPAFVFGSSSGAIIALELLLKHPEQLTKVVAHEPPLINLLPDAGHWHSFFSTVHATAARSGTTAAMAQFGAQIGLESPQLPPIETLPPHVIDMLTRMEQNNEFFLEHELRQYTDVTINLAQLRKLSTHVVLAGGSESHQFLPYRPNLVLSDELNLPIVDFPGNHVGYLTHPAEFGTQLRKPLLGSSPLKAS